METINTVNTVRFLRGDLACKVQRRRDDRQLAEILRIEALLAACSVRA